MLPWLQNDTLSETNPGTKITPSRAAHPVTQYMEVPPPLSAHLNSIISATVWSWERNEPILETKDAGQQHT